MDEPMGMNVLRRKLASVVRSVNGRVGVAVQDTISGEEVGVAADEPFPMASVCKTPILVAAFRKAESGALDLGRRVAIGRSERVAGSGLLNFFDEGLQPTLRDLLLLMIVVSDNAATDLVLHEVGGPAAVTAAMRQLGLADIRLDRTIRQLLKDIHVAIDPVAAGLDYFEFEALLRDDEGAAERYRDNDRVFAAIIEITLGRDVAMPRDIARLYGQLARGECATAESCEAILKTLERQQLRGRLPRDLPPRTRCCHKTGTLGEGNVCNDTGLIFVGDRAIAVAVLSREVRQDPAETNTAIARIGRIVYDHYSH
jgi:beta-lactamase class A